MRKKGQSDAYNPLHDLRMIMQGSGVDDDENFDDEYLALLAEIGEKKPEVKVVPKKEENIMIEKPKPERQVKQNHIEDVIETPMIEEKPVGQSKPKINPETKAKPEAQLNRNSVETMGGSPKNAKPAAMQVSKSPSKREPVAPKGYIDEKATPEYGEVFEIFADSFYSFIHSNKTRPKYLEQMKKLAPVVVAGPKADIDELELMKPKYAAKRYRTYDEFCKNPISTAENEEECQGMITAMEQQLKEIKADAGLLLRYNDTAGAKTVAQYASILSQSIEKVKESPYYVPDLAHYYIPNLNQDIPPGKLRIHVKQITGVEYSHSVSVVIRLPFGDIRTPEGSPPNFDMNYTVMTKALDFRDPKVLNNLKKQRYGVGVMKKSAKELVGFGTFSLSRLFTHKDVSFSVGLEDRPGSAVLFDISIHAALSAFEKLHISKPIIVAPSVVFSVAPTVKDNPVTRKSAGEAGLAQVDPKKQLRQKQTVACPRIYVPTEEELDMFWGIQVIEFWIKASAAAIEKSRSANVPIQAGVELMNRIWTAKREQLVGDIESGKTTMEQFIMNLQEARKRETGRLKSFTDEFVLGEHRGFLAMIEAELASFYE